MRFFENFRKTNGLKKSQRTFKLHGKSSQKRHTLKMQPVNQTMKYWAILYPCSSFWSYRASWVLCNLQRHQLEMSY